MFLLDYGECTSIVEDKAIIFRKGDVEDLKEKLMMICENKKIVQQYREKVFDYICKKYSWDDVVARTIEVYRKR